MQGNVIWVTSRMSAWPSVGQANVVFLPPNWQLSIEDDILRETNVTSVAIAQPLMRKPHI